MEYDYRSPPSVSWTPWYMKAIKRARGLFMALPCVRLSCTSFGGYSNRPYCRYIFRYLMARPSQTLSLYFFAVLSLATRCMPPKDLLHRDSNPMLSITHKKICLTFVDALLHQCHFHCRTAAITHQNSYYEIYRSDGRVIRALLVCRSPWGPMVRVPTNQ